VIPAPPSVPLTACEVTYREGYAQLPQSTTADKINRQGINFIYYHKDPLMHPVELLSQVHDSVVFQLPLSLGWLHHAEVILRIKKSLEQPLTWHDLTIPTPADLSIGLNMSKDDMKELKSKEIPSTPSQLADKLEEVYNEISKTKL
jgi:hypothetical protein